MAEQIRISGQVIDFLTQTPLEGVKVTAVQKGAQIQMETSASGLFLLHLNPGKWKISASLQGYTDPEAYVYSFQKDADQINFELVEGYSLDGEVVSEEDGSPVPGVVVEATPKQDGKGKTKKEVSGIDGKFSFSNLFKGEWKVDGDPKERSIEAKTVLLGPENGQVRLVMTKEMTDNDRTGGLIFFFTLLVLLGGLIWSYLWLHNTFPAGREPEVAGFINLVEQVGEIAGNANDGVIDCNNEGVAKTPESTCMQLLRSSITSMKESWDGVSSDIYSLSIAQKKQIDLLISGAVTSASTDNVAEIKLVTDSTLSILQNQHIVYLWSDPPWSYLEVLYWSMAGIIVSVFFTIGYYLRRKIFIGAGIWMHISHLLTVPVIALVVVLLISIIKLNIQIENSDVAINLDDPRLLVAISFIISVRPWKILDFVKDTADKIFQQNKDKIAGGPKNQSTTTTTVTK